MPVTVRPAAITVAARSVDALVNLGTAPPPRPDLTDVWANTILTPPQIARV